MYRAAARCVAAYCCIYKSTRKPTAFRQRGDLVRGAGVQATYRVRHEVPLLYEQVAKRIANIIDKRPKHCRRAAVTFKPHIGFKIND